MSGKIDAWMPLYIGDYIRDTQHLTAVQHGAYLLLLMAYWSGGGALPDDDAQLAQIARVRSPEWRRMKPTILNFFSLINGRWQQKRAEIELQKAREKMAVKSSAGRKGASARWNGGKGDGKRIAKASLCHWQTDGSSQSQSPPDTSLSEVGCADSNTEMDDAFAALATAYPNPMGSSLERARRCWNAHYAELPPISDLLKRVELFKAFIARENQLRPKTDPFRVCSLATWLGEARWKTVKPASEPKTLVLPPDWGVPGARLSRAIGENVFAAWFFGAELELGPPAKICVRSTFYKRQIEDRFRIKLEEIFGEDVVISLIKDCAGEGACHAA